VEQQNFPLIAKHDLRVASPQPLFRSMADLLENGEFQLVQIEKPELIPGALPGTASFQAYLLGIHDFAPKNTRYVLPGLLMALGISIILGIATIVGREVNFDGFLLILTLGLGLIMTGLGVNKIRNVGRRIRHLIDIRFEGESYKAEASTSTQNISPTYGANTRLERVGVITDVRITLSAGIGIAAGETSVSKWIPASKNELIITTSSGIDATCFPLLTQQNLGLQLEHSVAQFALTEG
jgi:hypothetical protein